MRRIGLALIWMNLLFAGPAFCLVAAPQDSADRNGMYFLDTLPAQNTGPEISSEKDPIAQNGRMISDYTERILQRFDKSPLFITILYIVILYSIITLITLLIIILLNRNRLQREEEQREYLKEAYQLKLMDYLFEQEKREQAMKDLREIASNRFKRQILINQMIDLSINLKGKIKEVIKELYIEMGLKRDSLEKAFSKKWHENVKGFRELAFMNIRDANERILECLNSRNEIVRMEAQIALVRLSDSNPYHFLHYLEKPLALWEQITLHELLIQHELKVPAFKQWFESENTSVVIFALEMVSWFKQKRSGSEVIRLFSHENAEVRHTAFKVSGDIGLKTALPALKKIYHQETYRNKMAILDTFARVPEERYLPFLKSVLDDEEDVQLQILATKAMENTDEPGISMLIKLMKSKSGYKNYQIIIRHVLDGRIY
jgi:hypothetical protein